MIRAHDGGVDHLQRVGHHPAQGEPFEDQVPQAR